MTLGTGEQTTADPQPISADFQGWRMVWVGAVVVVIGWFGRGWMQVLPPAFREFPAAGDDGGFGLASAYGLLAGSAPLLAIPLAGWAIDRWGARRLILWGFVTLAIGGVLYAGHQVTAALYLSLAFVGVGTALGTQLPAAAAVNNWFRRRRATAMAVLMLPSVALSHLLDITRSAPEPLTQIDSRLASVAAAAVVLILAWPLSRQIRNRPEDIGQHPDGVGPDCQVETEADETEVAQWADSAGVVHDYTWREALRTRAFWLLVVGGLVVSVASGGRFFRSAILRQYEFGQESAGQVLSYEELCFLAFMLVGGWMADRYPVGRVMFAFGLVQAIGVGVLAFAQTLPMVYLATALAGAGAGGAYPLAFAANGAYFGRRNFATITAISMMIMTLNPGLSVGSVLFYLLPGTHTLPLAIIMVISAAGSAGFLFLGRPRLAPSQRKAGEEGEG